MMGTVKRIDIEGRIINTHQTEAELNGWREKQHQLFERDDYKRRQAPDPRQRSMFDEA